MSRPQPVDDIQTYTLMPPVRGLYNPYRKYNPLAARGHSTTFRLWRISRGELASLIEGTQTLSGQDNTGTASHNKFMMTHRLSTTDVIRLFYVYGQSLRWFPLDNSGAETEITAAFTPADTAARYGGARFRQRILVATKTNGLWWINPEAATARKAGVTVPAAPTGTEGAAGALGAGTYKLYYTYVNDQGHEGNPNVTAGSVTIAGSKKISWADITAGPTGTSSRRLYRSTVGATTGLFLATIADNSTTTYTDNTVDASLGAAVDTDNTIPSDTLQNICVSPTRVYLLDTDGLTVWASKIDSTTGLPNWEAFPSRLSLSMAFAGGRDYGKALWYLSGDVYVPGGLMIARIVGDVASGVTVEGPMPKMGLLTPFAYDIIGQGDAVVFINNLKQLIHWRPADGTIKNIGEKVQGLLDLLVDGAGLDGPAVCYDPMWNCVYVSYGTTSAVANNKSLAVDLQSGEPFEPGYEFNAMYYCPFMRGLYGYRHQVAAINGWYAAQAETPTYATYPLLTFGNNKIEMFQWSPSPGDDIDFLNLQILVKGQARSGDVPPLASLEFALDGGGRFRKYYLLCNKRQLVDVDGESVVIFSAAVSISRVAKYLTVRLTVPSNTANTTNGFELYAVNCDARILNQTRDGRKGLGEGARRVYR